MIIEFTMLSTLKLMTIRKWTPLTKNIDTFNRESTKLDILIQHKLKGCDMNATLNALK